MTFLARLALIPVLAHFGATGFQEPQAIRLSRRAPAILDGYARREFRDFQRPTGDVAYDYSNQTETRLTVFFYGREPQDSVVAGSDGVARQAELFREALRIERERGRYASYKIAVDEEDSIGVGGQPIPGRSLIVVFTTKRGTFVSFYYVWAIGQTFVKVRGTVPEQSWESTDVPLFARDLISRVAAP